MLYSANNSTVVIGDVHLDYISFGKGKRNLVILPGLGDGLKTVKGMALPMALMYRIFAKDFKVYMFSSRRDMPQGYTTENMAADLKKAMDILQIDRTDVVGVSMGGMISQHLAADYPEKINKLVLCVTSSKSNSLIKNSVSEWINMAKEDSFKKLMADNVKQMYTEKYYKKYKPLIPLVSAVTKPKSFDRFIVMANACINHNSAEKLKNITAPTLVIGAEKDMVVGGDESVFIEKSIKNTRLVMYKEYGHAVYEEAKDFNKTILDFLK